MGSQDTQQNNTEHKQFLSRRYCNKPCVLTLLTHIYIFTNTYICRVKYYILCSCFPDQKPYIADGLVLSKKTTKKRQKSLISNSFLLYSPLNCWVELTRSPI